MIMQTSTLVLVIMQSPPLSEIALTAENPKEETSVIQGWLGFGVYSCRWFPCRKDPAVHGQCFD